MYRLKIFFFFLLLFQFKCHSKVPEFEQVVIYLVKALIKLRNWSTIHGLYVYLNQTLKKRYNWIKATIEEAKGKYVLMDETFCF